MYRVCFKKTLYYHGQARHASPECSPCQLVSHYSLAHNIPNTIYA
jgi:hypothetical protein